MAASTETPSHTFIFNDRELTGHAGDTLASALLAHGVHQVTTSIKLGRPRGFTAAWAEDTGGLVQIEQPFPEPMLLATTVELYDGLVARGIRGPGPARRDPRHRQIRCHPRTRRRAGRRGGAGRSGRRPDRGPRRRAGGAASTSRARPAARCWGAPTPSTAGRRMEWVADAVAELADLPRRAAPAAHHGVRPLRRRLRPCAATTYRPSRRRGARGGQPAAGVAHPRPARRRRRRRPRAPCRVHRQRPPRDHARPRCAHLPAPLRSEGRRHRPSSSPPTTAPTWRRSTCTTPACGSTQSSTPAPTWRRTCARRAPPAASRCGPDRWSAAPRATTRITAALVVRPADQFRRRARWPVTCCSSVAAGIRPCTCSARYAASCATTTPSARSYPVSNSTG